MQATRLQNLLCCPQCRAELADCTDALRCSSCDVMYRIEGGVARLVPPTLQTPSVRFYNEADLDRYGRSAEEMPDYLRSPVAAFLREVPAESFAVEIGSGRGAFSGCHPGHVAVDFSFFALARFASGIRVQADAQRLPFRSGSIHAVFTVATLEHIPDPALALAEIDRCLRPGGKALLHPAWYVRSWAAKGLATKGFAGLSYLDRVRKVSIPLRDSRPYRFARVLPGRLLRELQLRRGVRLALSYRRLQPNLDTYIVSDSDAFASLDPQAVSAFFVSRGYQDINRPRSLSRLLYGYEPVVVVKPARETLGAQEPRRFHATSAPSRHD